MKIDYTYSGVAIYLDNREFNREFENLQDEILKVFNVHNTYHEAPVVKENRPSTLYPFLTKLLLARSPEDVK